jgi:outer membrane cobalamin receptor
MNRLIKRIQFIIISISSLVFAQQGPGGGAKISGLIIDSVSGMPVEYANIILFRNEDSVQVTGTISSKDGRFEINRIDPGNYYVDILFIGYQRERIQDIEINQNRLNDIGTILIKPTSINLNDVVVSSDRPSISYQIDKKVINVEQFGTTISGTAADVLENVPSITVDIEGNVSLRGSGNFTVLIDGRPTVMDAQDVLQQIPASTIENIEIVTNPSAKYNPEGTAGIINLILKKNQNTGLNGLVNLNAGLKEKYGGDFLFEYKNSSLKTLFGLDYNNRFFPGNSSRVDQYLFEGNTTTINSEGSSRRGRKSFGLRAGLDFTFSKNNFLTLSGRYGNRNGLNNSSSNNIEFSTTNPLHVLRTNISNSERGGDFFEVNVNYLHKFEPAGHELSADVSYEYHNSDELNTSELFENQAIVTGRKTTEAGPSDEINSRINYQLPFSKTDKFEAGYQGEMDISKEATSLSEFNITTGNYELLNQFSNKVKFDENEHAFYLIYTGEWNNFGYQAGFRSEYTKRIVELTNTGEEFKIDRWDYFPTIHSSYKFAGGQQLIASYTRRINRPGGWALEPFYTWDDAHNIRVGNPSLKNEFIDSYEIGAQTFLGLVSLSAELYYSVTHNKIEHVRSVYAENVTLQTFENVGKDFSLGSEFMAGFDLEKIWSVNLMGNIYEYRVEGILYDQFFEERSFNWRGRMSNVLKFGSTQIQINAMYNSPSVSAQGRREGFVSTDVAVKQEFWDKKLSLTLQVRDLLNTSKHEFTSSGPDFYFHNSFTRESPMVMLNIRYTINNMKQQRERERGDEGFDEDEEF